MDKGQDCQQAAAEVAWPLLDEIRNAFEAKITAKQEIVCVKQVTVKGQLQQERDIQLASSVLASDWASKSDKVEDKMEMLAYCLRLGGHKEKRVQVRFMCKHPLWDPRTMERFRK